MKTKFRMNFGWWKTLILGIVTASCAAVDIIDIILLVGTKTLKTSNPAVAGVSIFAATLIMVASLLVMFNSYYRFDSDKLFMVLGVFTDKVKYLNVESAAVNEKTGQVVLVITSDVDETKRDAIGLNLNPENGRKFLDAFKEKNPYLEVNTITDEGKGKKGK